MALAANVRQYVPPKRIQQMEAELAALACVWEGTRFAGPWGWSLATKQRYRLMGVPMEMLPSDEWLEEVRRLSSREFAWRYLMQMLAAMKGDGLLGGEMNYWVKLPSLSEQDEGGTKAYPRGPLYRTRGVHHAVPEGSVSLICHFQMSENGEKSEKISNFGQSSFMFFAHFVREWVMVISIKVK